MSQKYNGEELLSSELGKFVQWNCFFMLFWQKKAKQILSLWKIWNRKRVIFFQN